MNGTGVLRIWNKVQLSKQELSKVYILMYIWRYNSYDKIIITGLYSIDSQIWVWHHKKAARKVKTPPVFPKTKSAPKPITQIVKDCKAKLKKLNLSTFRIITFQHASKSWHPHPPTLSLLAQCSLLLFSFNHESVLMTWHYAKHNVSAFKLNL